MILCSHKNSRKAGLTLLDLLVVISGILPALWVSSYFHGTWRTAMLYILTFVFGIGFWCLLFLWLVPLIDRRRKDRSLSDDDHAA
jgi:hypothetical protein